MAHRTVVAALAVMVAWLSIRPMRNMLSPRQVMNTTYNPLHLVGTYGAFGSITRERYEIVVEGTDEAVVTDSTQWREYEFSGKPTDDRPHAAADRAVSSAARLADVVRRDVRLQRQPLVRAFHGEAAAGRCRDAVAVAVESVSGPAAALCSGAVVPIPLHDAGGAPGGPGGGGSASSRVPISRWCRWIPRG